MTIHRFGALPSSGLTIVAALRNKVEEKSPYSPSVVCNLVRATAKLEMSMQQGVLQYLLRIST
jgi:hypothetical protein